METKVWTQEQFEAHATGWARRTLLGRSDRAVGVRPFWVMRRELRILCEDGIRRDTVQLVAEEIQQAIREIGIGFRFEISFIGSGWREDGRDVRVSDYIAPSLVRGQVDHDALFDMSYREVYRQHAQHADVYITQRAFVDDGVSWGAAEFEHGCMVLTLHGARQLQRDYLRNVVRHEMGHLLGMPLHCDDMRVDGYRYQTDCNMHYSVPSGEKCPKCRQFLHLWWQEVERHVSSR